MRPLFFAFFLLLTLILQSTLVPLVAINGIRPDLLLIIVVLSALLLGKETGACLGFFTGLLQDLVSGNIFGLNILSKLATGFLAGVMERKVFKENFFLPVLAVAVATAFNSLVMLLILYIFGFNIELLPALVNAFYILIYNAIVAIPIHQIGCLVYKKWVAN